MGVRDIFRSGQLSSQLFFQKSYQGNCHVYCATKNVLQDNYQVNFFLQKQVNCVTKKILQGHCQVNYLVKNYLIFMSIIVIVRSILVNYHKFWSIMVNYGQL